ncbi:MAG: Lrp/AsnC family transcriptional regulator [Desulfobacterales bacterium]|nr:Lrp/AsnC family transcriptional regulator [Desulfobacterales bacterium]
MDNNQDLDFKITMLLTGNGRMSNREISKKLGVSETTIRKRVQNLLNEEKIQVTAMINPLKITTGLLGNVRVRAKHGKVDTVAKKLEQIEELWYIDQLFGPAQFECEFFVKSQDQIATVADKIDKIDGVESIEVCFLVRHIKNHMGFGPSF